MTGDIKNAIQKEMLRLIGGSSCTVMYREAVKDDELGSYAMPLITIEGDIGNETGQCIGGWTMYIWQITLQVYNSAPDVSGMDPTAYSATRINVTDDVRRYFSNYGVFASPEMQAALTAYGLRLTLTGGGSADPLAGSNGLIHGDKLTFDTVSYDYETSGMEYKKALDAIVDLNPPTNR